jgi:C4-dicarboxylate-binding protein DctP
MNTGTSRRRALALLAVAAGTLALAIPVRAQAPLVVKFSHVVAAGTPKGMAADFFAKKAAELTKGKVKVEVYPNSQLYKDNEELEALQLGSVQMLAPSLAKFGPIGVREFEVFDLPFIFDGYKDLHKVTQGPIGKQLLDKLEGKGVRGLAFWDNGFKSFSANKPSSILPTSRIKDADPCRRCSRRSARRCPRVMAFSEVGALQTGVVDGTREPDLNLYPEDVRQSISAHRARLPGLR